MTERIYLGGMTHTTLHYEQDGTLHVEEKQDCEAILERAQRKRDHRFNGMSPEGTVAEVAEVPEVVYLAKCREIGQRPFATPDVAMELILKDPQYAKFRTAPTLRDPHVIVRGLR